MHSNRVILSSFLGLLMICLLGYLGWRPVTPTANIQPDDVPLPAITIDPTAVRSGLESLPEPVQRVISAASEERAVQPKWKGADSLDQNEEQSLWRAFSQAKHEIHLVTAHQATLPENDGAIYLASSSSQKLRARFLENGLRLLPNQAGSDWSAEIGLASQESKPQIAQVGTVLQYHHANGVTEWFDNGPDGIEHGFIVQENSSLNHGERLRVPVRLAGLIAEAEENRGDLRLVNSAGETVLTYEKLQVWDAGGSALAAHMAPSASGLEISVDVVGARFPVVIDPLILSEQAQLGPELAGSGAPGDAFSQSLCLSGDTALIGAFGDDDNGLNSGSAYVFIRSGASWSLQQKLRAPDGTKDDHFGEAVSLSGETALIGAAQAENLGNGKAYVFVRSGAVWSLQQQLTASDGASDAFGGSLSLSGDTALIGAADDDDGSTLSSGSAYVFVRSGTSWTQQQKLTASDPGIADHFGFTVSLSGETALIGAYGSDHSSFINAGSAYVFVRSGSVWSQQQKLIAADPGASSAFGWSVSLSGDTGLIGDFLDNDMGSSSGSAYVFTRSGTVWSQQQKLVAADGATDDYFGKSVCLSGDTAVISSEGDDGIPYVNSGSAYVFMRSGTTWSLQQKLIPPGDMTNGVLGQAVTLSGDTLLIGTNENKYNDGGSGLVFIRENSVWTLQQRLTAGDGAAFDRFGTTVSLEGDTALIGTTGDDDNGIDSGSAYVFVRNGSTWSQQQKLIASDGASQDFFGGAVSVSGDIALVGADDRDLYGALLGAAYVFVRNGNTWSEAQKLNGSVSGEASFGKSVSVSGETVLIGAPRSMVNGLATGAAYVFVRNGVLWSKQQKLSASDGQANDQFGSAVSLWNDTALVGANEDDNKGGESGSAYVFVRNGSSWSQQENLNASDGEPGDFFGSAVSLSGDTALIGAYGDDDNGTSSGSAYVFVRHEHSWSQQKKLKPADGGPYDFFGASVSISGASALVGAYGDDVNAVDNGSAYLFWRSGPDWSEQQKLIAPGGEDFDNFGVSVSISGYTALVGANMDDGVDSLGGLARDQGSVYVFQNTNPDVDGDGLLNEYETGTGIYVSGEDTGTDPFNPDSDNDGLTDGDEVNLHGTNPHLADSDGDHYLDATEVAEGGDPMDSASTPLMQPQITPAKQLTFFSRAGVNYQIEGSETGDGGSWTRLVWPIWGTGEAVSAVVTTPPPYLRVVAAP